MENDKLKQQPGPQQGNIHQDANEGTNKDGHQGSTLHKLQDDEHVKKTSSEEIETDKAKDSGQDTMGNP